MQPLYSQIILIRHPENSSAGSRNCVNSEISSSWCENNCSARSRPSRSFHRSIVCRGFSLIFSEEVLLLLPSLDSYLPFALPSSFPRRLMSALFFLWSHPGNSSSERIPLRVLSWASELKLKLRFSLSMERSLSLLRCLLPNLWRLALMPPSSLRWLRWEQTGLSCSACVALSSSGASRLSLSSGYLKVQLLQCLRAWSKDSLALVGRTQASLPVVSRVFSSSFSTSRFTNPSNGFSSASEQERRQAFSVCRSAVNSNGSGAYSSSAVSTNLVSCLSSGFILYYCGSQTLSYTPAKSPRNSADSPLAKIDQSVRSAVSQALGRRGMGYNRYGRGGGDPNGGLRVHGEVLHRAGFVRQGVPGSEREERAGGGDQGDGRAADLGAGDRTRDHHPQAAQAPQHRRVRGRLPKQRLLLHRHRVLQGRRPAQPPRQQRRGGLPRTTAQDTRHVLAGLRGLQVPARVRHHPPRPEALEHPAAGRAVQDRGLRTGAARDGAPQRGPPGDDGRPHLPLSADPLQKPLHLQVRRLVPRHHRLRNALRPPPLEGQRRRNPLLPNHEQPRTLPGPRLHHLPALPRNLQKNTRLPREGQELLGRTAHPQGRQTPRGQEEGAEEGEKGRYSNLTHPQEHEQGIGLNPEAHPGTRTGAGERVDGDHERGVPSGAVRNDKEVRGGGKRAAGHAAGLLLHLPEAGGQQPPPPAHGVREARGVAPTPRLHRTPPRLRQQHRAPHRLLQKYLPEQPPQQGHLRVRSLSHQQGQYAPRRPARPTLITPILSKCASAFWKWRADGVRMDEGQLAPRRGRMPRPLLFSSRLSSSSFSMTSLGSTWSWRLKWSLTAGGRSCSVAGILKQLCVGVRVPGTCGGRTG